MAASAPCDEAGNVYHCPRVTLSALTLARAGQCGVAGVAAGCWVVGGAAAGGAAAAAAAGRAAAGAAAGRTRSQRPFTMLQKSQLERAEVDDFRHGNLPPFG
jgi:hypothetical protein